MEKEVAQMFCKIAEKFLVQSEYQTATTKHFLTATKTLQDQIGILAHTVKSGDVEHLGTLIEAINKHGENQEANHKALLDMIARLESEHDGFNAQLFELKRKLGLDDEPPTG